MTHRALLYCRYTEFYQLLCVSEMSSWFSVQSWKALGFRWWWEPGQDLRVLIMSIINIFHFQVALVCLPLRDVSAESRAGLGSLVSLIFYCFPRGKGRNSRPVLLLMRFIFFSPRVRALSVQLWFIKQNFFLSYGQIIIFLENIRPSYLSSVTGRNLWSRAISEAQTRELPGSSANLFTSGWMLTLT